jgi:hypothetical protein
VRGAGHRTDGDASGGGRGADLERANGNALERGVELACRDVRHPSLEDVHMELTRPAPEARVVLIQGLRF